MAEHAPVRPSRPDFSAPVQATQMSLQAGKPPISPGRLGSLGAAALAATPGALENMIRLAEGAGTVRTRLEAAKLLLLIAGLKTPKTLVDHARAAIPVAVQALTDIASGKIVGADDVAVEASAALFNLLRQ